MIEIDIENKILLIPSGLGVPTGEIDEEYDDLINEANNLRQEVSKLNGQVTDLRDDNNALEAKKKALEAEKETLTNEKATLENEKATLEEENQILQDANERITFDNNNLSNENNTLSKENENLAQDVANLNGQVTDLQGQKDALENEKTALEETNNTLTQEKEQLQKEKDALQEIVDNGTTAKLNFDGLTFTALEDNSSISLDTKLSNNVIQYVLNNGDWETLDTNTKIPMRKGDMVYVRGYNNSLYDFNNKIGTHFNMTGKIKVCGNIMSLLYGSQFEDKVDLKHGVGNYTFMSLFANNTALVDASKLILPAKYLAIYCYAYMFQGCTQLIKGPTLLPSIYLVSYCYCGMFSNCSSLIEAPNLVAPFYTKNNNYTEMFEYCTSLETAPILYFTTLGDDTYVNMFRGCTNLREIYTCLRRIDFEIDMKNWMLDVAPTGTFHNLGGAKFSKGPSGIPDGWTETNA